MPSIRGEVWVRRPSGLLVAHGKNLVVDAGLDLLAKITGGVGTLLSHMAIGNSNSASQPAMTALQGTELERVALTSTTVSNNTITYAATFGASISITVTIREIGIFNDLVGGEMLSRFICSGFDLSAGESVAVTWAMTFSGSGA